MHNLIKKGVVVGLASFTVAGSMATMGDSLLQAASENDESSQTQSSKDKEPSLSSSQTSSSSTNASSSSLPDSSSNNDLKGSSQQKNQKEQNKSTENDQKSAEAILAPNKALGPGFYDVPKASTFGRSRASRSLAYTQELINSVAPGAIAGWQRYQILPSVTIAQAAVESDWGRSYLTTQANNLFGIKGSYQGQSLVLPTKEYVGDHYITINAAFRKYPSRTASINDHGSFLNVNSRYKNILGVRDYRKVTQGLQSAGYATSPTYANTLNSIISQYDLTQYDRIALNKAKYGSLDTFKVVNNQLQIGGWHAADLSYGKPYHFLFFMDATTHKELMRVKVPTYTRNDVKRAHPNVYNSVNSGFKFSAMLGKRLATKKFYVKSRYSSDSRGTRNYTDFDFSNQILNAKQKTTNENKASLDTFGFNNGSIRLGGWHAADRAQGKPYHFLFIMDADTHKELKRVRVSNYTRNDVARTYPRLYNAGKSGFKLSVGVNSRMRNKRVYVMSRYSSDSHGNKNYVDYHFSKKTMKIGSAANKASIDTLKVSNGKINIGGWHAADSAQGKSYHFLFIMNAANGKELGRVKVPTYTRNDVARAYPSLYNARKSGFRYNWPISKKFRGKRIYVMSRYSSDPHGNRDYVGYYANGKTISIPK